MADTFQDILLRYAHVRARAERGITRDVLRDLSSLRDEIKSLLARIGPLDGPLKAVRLRQLVQAIDRLIQETEAKLKETLKAGLVDLGRADTDILREPLGAMVDRDLTGPSPAMIAGVATGFYLGLTRSLTRAKAGLFQAFTTETPDSLDDAVSIVNDAFASARVDLDRLTTTAATSVLTEVTTSLYREAGIDTWRWDATLDSRTCLLCAELDGQLIGVGVRQDRPPRHLRCRCVLIPVLPDQPESGFTSPGRYEQWLEQQPEEIQREVLGPTRFRLFMQDRQKPGFQQGGLPLWEGVENNRIIPVARLKQDWAALLALQEKAAARGG